MSAGHEREIAPVTIKMEGYSNVAGKVLVSPESGWKDYVMRRFEIGKDGYSGHHRHDFPHIVFVAEGKGTMIMEGEEKPIEKGSFAYVPNNALHQLKNTDPDVSPLVFICIVPQANHTFG